MSPKRLFVIDAMALAFRSFYAFGMRPLTTAAGQPVSAIFGSAMFLQKLITEQKPDYLVVASDSAEPTFRHLLYPKYKANRSEMPADLVLQLPGFYKLVQAFDCHLIKQSGVEADDLIGTLAKRFASKDLHVYIVSGDKDFMQLISDDIFLYIPKKGEDAIIVDRDGVHGKFACTPEQVIDCLALIGDASDNVPGVLGIGEKGAGKLISTYGSLDNIYAHVDEVMNKKQREALLQSKEMAYLSRKLVTLKTDLVLDFKIEDFACDPAHAVANEDLLLLYKEFEFQNLETRVSKALAAREKTGDLRPPTGPTTIDDTYYKLVQTKDELTKLITKFSQVPLFAFDTETTGLDIINDRPIGISLSCESGHAYYVPIEARHLKDLAPSEVLDALKPLLTNPKTRKLGHNLKFDLQMMNNVGIAVEGPYGDSMILDFLLDAGSRQHGLDSCCLRHLNYKKIPTSSLIGDKGQIPMLDADLDELARYGCEDADLTFRLYEHLLVKIQEASLSGVLEDIEMPLVPVLARMEQEGIFIDAGDLNEFSNRLAEMSHEVEARIYKEADGEFNINSTKQLQEILFNKLKIPEQLGVKKIKKTKTGLSTDESVLSQLKAHPLPRAILEYRTISKLKNTYVDTLPQLIKPKTGRVHSCFHQTGTATGRLSSSDPNLQNIPIRTELGQEIRKAFKPQTPDSVLISADYSQVELRLLAHIADEKALSQAFLEGQDIHRSTAARIFGIEPKEVDAVMRSRAKAINFGIIYGMGPRRLSQETGVSMAQASEFIKRYFASYPGIETYIAKAIASAREKGYSETITGRKRPISGLNGDNKRVIASAENIAVNSPIQGSAADLIKLAMISIDDTLRERGLRTKMLLQVHDELVFECPKSEIDEAKAIICQGMENAMKLNVPLKVEMDVGSNWLEAH